MPDEEQSPLYHYVCQHGASNTPDACFPGAEPVPDNWYELDEFLPAGPPGMTDAVT